jgi:hypothetical protein
MTTRFVRLSPQDVADLRREVAYLTEYLCDQGEPETDEQIIQRGMDERRLNLMHRLLGDVPPGFRAHWTAMDRHFSRAARAMRKVDKDGRAVWAPVPTYEEPKAVSGERGAGRSSSGGRALWPSSRSWPARIRTCSRWLWRRSRSGGGRRPTTERPRISAEQPTTKE